MTSNTIVTWLTRWPQIVLGRNGKPARPPLDRLAQPETLLPRFVQESPVAMRYLHLLGPLDWSHFPERDLQRNWSLPAVPYRPFVAATLVKLDQQLTCMSQLRHFLVEHPALVWLLGFPLVPSPSFPWGFDAAASLPTARHLTRMLRHLPNPALQFLLDDTVCLLRSELTGEADSFGQTVAVDTKHILAWVQENNPKAYLPNSARYDKTRQPKGDPDCRLGCKRRHNQRATAKEPTPTPTANPVPAGTLSVGEYYWGYASGVVVTQVKGWGELVLAELTQPFDQADVSYFFPLLAATERRLGFRPPYGAFDAAFDAFYVYEHFHRPGQEGFAAVPLVERGGRGLRTFDDDGLPLCPAGLSMPLRYTFIDHTAFVEHQCGRYVCPLLFPQDAGRPCPVNDPHWAKGGCKTTLPTSIGARLRYQLDRESAAYKQVYQQRTAAERIHAQAKELGIERPHLRNRQAIANLNTLIYVLINLRALQRIRRQKADRRASA